MLHVPKKKHIHVAVAGDSSASWMLLHHLSTICTNQKIRAATSLQALLSFWMLPTVAESIPYLPRLSQTPFFPVLPLTIPVLRHMLQSSILPKFVQRGSQRISIYRAQVQRGRLPSEQRRAAAGQAIHGPARPTAVLLYPVRLAHQIIRPTIGFLTVRVVFFEMMCGKRSNKTM